MLAHGGFCVGGACGASHPAQKRGASGKWCVCGAIRVLKRGASEKWCVGGAICVLKREVRKVGAVRVRLYTRQNQQGIVGVRLVCFCWNRVVSVV